MRFDIAVFLSGVGLIFGGVTGGGFGLVLAGTGVLAALLAFRKWRKWNDTLNLLTMGFPGSEPDIKRGQAGETIGYLGAVPNDRAIEAVRHVWTAMYIMYPQRRSRLAALVRDASGRYWGTDYVRMNPPHSQWVYQGEVDPGGRLVHEAVKAGAMRLDGGKHLYQLESARPWGPLDSPASIGFGLPLHPSGTNQ